MHTEMSWTRREWLAFALAHALGTPALPALAGPAAVGEALARPALAARQGERAVLLGAARAGRRLVAVGERGLVLVSDDDGQRWSQRPTSVSVSLTAVRFSDDTHGVAVGHGGVVLLSADAGQTWAPALDGRRSATMALEAARARADAAAEAEAQRLVADGPDKPFLDVLTTSRQELLVVGAYGLVFGSGDGGRSWTPWMDRLHNPKAQHAYAVRRRGDVIVIAGEQGLLQRSTDAGRSFRRIESPYKGSFFTLELPGDAEMVVAGLRGNAWRSRDEGRSWTRVEAPMPASITASLLAPDGEILLANQAGFVLRLAGDRLVPAHATPLAPINAFVAIHGLRLAALTLAGIVPLALTPKAS